MQGFTVVDAVVMFAYLSGIVALGMFLGRGQKNASDFFLGGRTFGWLPIALSVIATDLSAVSYMGVPAIAFQSDLRYAVGIFFMPLAVCIVLPVTLRAFYNRGVFTVYEYLEQRYNVTIRMATSLLFIMMRVGWLASAIYVPALALSVVTNLPLLPCIIGAGLLATLYATFGGIKAVIWCDVVQFFVLMGGVLIALLFITIDFNGDVAGIWHAASKGGHTRIFDFDPSLNAEYSFWSVALGSLVAYMAAQGTDQVVVQRYLSAKSMGQVMRGAVGQSIIVIPVILLMFLSGTALAAYYGQNPEMMASLLSIDPADPIASQDRVLPHFFTYGLPQGITGLVIAGILAATMSSVDSGVNSLAAVAIVDFYKRVQSTQREDGHYLFAGRIATVCFGLLGTITALYIGQLGAIIVIMGKIGGFFTGPLVAVFFLGVLTKRANSAGVFCGLMAGLGLVWWIANSTEVFWGWWAPIGLMVTASAGYVMSIVWERSKRLST